MDHTLTRSKTRRKTNLAKHCRARVFDKKVVGLMQGFVKPSASQTFTLYLKVSFLQLEIRSVERGICPIATSTTNCSYNYGRMHGACTKRLYFHFGVKSDVTVVFLDPDFLKVAKISVIRVQLRQI